MRKYQGLLVFGLSALVFAALPALAGDEPLPPVNQAPQAARTCAPLLEPSLSAVAEWNADSAYGFQPLEIDGVAYNAIESAVLAAQAKGHRHVVVSLVDHESSIAEDRNNGRGYRRYLKMRAYVTPLSPGTTVGAAYTGTIQSISRGRTQSALECLGVRHRALAQALSACLRAGHLSCVFESTQLTQTNHLTGPAEFAEEAKYVTEAQAVVRGVSPGTQSFSAEATWSVDSGEFTDLQYSGIHFSALERAVQSARSQGHSDVALGTVELLRTSYGYDMQYGENRRSTTERAVVVSIKGKNVVPGDSFKGSSMWYSSQQSAHSELESMGIRYQALTDAMTRCLAAGYSLCVYEASNITALNSWDSEKRRYESSANAVVRGYKLQAP